MRKRTRTAAIITLSLFTWVASALTNASFAGDHYRIGTLNESRHYSDDDDFNSSHDGLYLVHNRNIFGTYFNSESAQSFFYARNRPLNDTFSFSYGFALGYDIGVVPMVAVSAQISILKITFTQEAAVIGLEFPI